MTQVQVVWLRGPLTTLAMVSLASYLSHGYKVVLWTYDAPSGLGEQVEVRDARELMDEHALEAYRFRPTGQMALACDRLKFEANLRYGGWMGDLDVTLLRPLPDGEEPYCFGPHHRYQAAFSLWRAVADSSLLHRVIAQDMRLPPIDWHANMRMFSECIEALSLQQYRVETLVNDDGFDDEEPIKALCRSGSTLPPEWEGLSAIHWGASGPFQRCHVEDGSYFANLRDALLP